MDFSKSNGRKKGHSGRKGFLDALANKVLEVKRPHPVRVGIDGVDASGKTTLANRLAHILALRGESIIRASIDSFHNTKSHRYRRGELSPDAYYFDSINFPVVASDILQPLGPDGNCRYRLESHDLKTDLSKQNNWKNASREQILIFDGVFLQRDELVGLLDFVIFLQVDFEVSVSRALDRNFEEIEDPEELRERYRQKYIAAQDMYMRACSPKKKADMVVLYNDFSNPVIVSEI